MQVAELIEVCRERLAEVNTAPLLHLIDVIVQHPGDPYHIYIFARSCRENGYEDLWRLATSVALSLPHTSCRQIFHRGRTKLAFGDWSGWADCEVRYINPAEYDSQSLYWRSIQWCKKAWNGQEDIRDQAIFVIADGDVGDGIQMLRFVPLVSAVAQSVILGVSDSLRSFVQSNIASDNVTITDREVDHGIAFRRYTWITSLAALCGALPPFVPLHAPNPRTLAGTRVQPRIGVCASAAALALLREDSSAVWHPLELCDVSEAANTISALDGVITLDSPIAHLAASMGVPTLTLLSTAADPRWGLGDTTPWYPSMRLIRQATPGDWAGVLAVVKGAIANEHWPPRIGVTVPGSVPPA